MMCFENLLQKLTLKILLVLYRHTNDTEKEHTNYEIFMLWGEHLVMSLHSSCTKAGTNNC